MTVIFLINDKFHNIVYLDNVIFHSRATASVIRSEFWVWTATKISDFQPIFNMLLPKCVCLRGSARTPPGASSAPPAGKHWFSILLRAPQNCWPQGPETPRSATVYILGSCMGRASARGPGRPAAHGPGRARLL